MNPHKLLGLVLMAAVGLGSRALFAEGDVMPRYKLEVGQELDYRVTEDTPSKTSALRGQIQVFVVGRLENGSWKLVIKDKIANIMGGDNQPLTEESLLNIEKDLDDRCERVEVATLSPEGHLEMRHAFDDEKQEWMLPPLPTEERESHGYTVALADGSSFTGKVAKHTADEWQLALAKKSPFDDVWELQNSATVKFDAHRGLPTRTEIVFLNKNTASAIRIFELKETHSHPAAEMPQLATDADKFIAAMAAYRKSMNHLDSDKNFAATQALDALNVLAKAALLGNRTPDFATALKQEVLVRSMAAKREVEDSTRRKQLQGQPAPTFALDQIGGGQQKLADLRGKVVVLDFWFRHCGYCIMAMPKIKQLVDAERGKPVVILGMNTDEKESDAQFVIDKMKLNYPTLKAPQQVVDAFKVNGFPTLILIDQQGTIRNISNDTADLEHDIDALLTK